MSNSIPEELISAYLDGELTAEERTRVETLLDESPHAAQLLADYRRLGTQLGELPTPVGEIDLTTQLMRRIATEVPTWDSAFTDIKAAETEPARSPTDSTPEPVLETQAASTTGQLVETTIRRSTWSVGSATLRYATGTCLAVLVCGFLTWRVIDRQHPREDLVAHSARDSALIESRLEETTDLDHNITFSSDMPGETSPEGEELGLAKGTSTFEAGEALVMKESLTREVAFASLGSTGKWRNGFVNGNVIEKADNFIERKISENVVWEDLREGEVAEVLFENGEQIVPIEVIVVDVEETANSVQMLLANNSITPAPLGENEVFGITSDRNGDTVRNGMGGSLTIGRSTSETPAIRGEESGTDNPLATDSEARGNTSEPTYQANGDTDASNNEAKHEKARKPVEFATIAGQPTDFYAIYYEAEPTQALNALVDVEQQREVSDLVICEPKSQQPDALWSNYNVDAKRISEAQNFYNTANSFVHQQQVQTLPERGASDIRNNSDQNAGKPAMLSRQVQSSTPQNASVTTGGTIPDQELTKTIRSQQEQEAANGVQPAPRGPTTKMKQGVKANVPDPQSPDPQSPDPQSPGEAASQPLPAQSIKNMGRARYSIGPRSAGKKMTGIDTDGDGLDGFELLGTPPVPPLAYRTRQPAQKREESLNDWGLQSSPATNYQRVIRYEQELVDLFNREAALELRELDRLVIQQEADLARDSASESGDGTTVLSDQIKEQPIPAQEARIVGEPPAEPKADKGPPPAPEKMRILLVFRKSPPAPEPTSESDAKAIQPAAKPAARPAAD